VEKTVNFHDFKQVSKPIKINVLFSQCCISSAMDGTYDGILWNDSDEDGDVRSVRKMKALAVKVETVTLIGKERI
jgi:hypothetical protein